MIRNYYGENYDKAMKNYADSAKQAKLDLLKKYPKATISKFEFNPVLTQDGSVTRVDVFFKNSDILSTDITSSTFKHDKNMWKWLHNNTVYNSSFPKIWSSGGTVQKLLLTEKTTPSELDEKVKTFPEYVLDYQVHNFNIYVDDVNFFKSNLPKIVIDTKLMYREMQESGALGNKVNTVWTLSKSYYQAIAAMYIITYRSGLSLQHLTRSDNIPKQITSLMKFHVYFTMRRIMYRLSKGGKDVANIIRLYIPDYQLLRNHLPLSGDWNLIIKDVQGDYRRYCARTSNGLTNLGQELLNQSIEVYMYALLGAQAKAKQSIVGSRASSREVQQVFRNIVEDAVVQYSPDVWINLMNKAITDTNVKLDMAVTPSTWLIPRRMVLLKTPIPGYNNLLRVSSESGMNVGYNSGLNFSEPKIPKEPEQSEKIPKDPKDSNKPKKVHVDVAEDLETLDTDTATDDEGAKKDRAQGADKDKKERTPTNSATSTTLPVIAVAAVFGIMISKFVL